MVDPQKQPGLKINQILLEEARFSHCSDWLTRPIPADGFPDLTLTIGLRFGRSAEGLGALIGVQVKTPEEPAIQQRYNLSVSIVGVIEVDGEPNLAPDEYALTAGASMLYPFVREVVANLSMRGRFGPIWLKPFNVKLAVADILASARAATSEPSAP